MAAYKKVSGEENVDQNILALLENEGGTTMETLSALRKTYDAQLEDKFPMHCNHCGSQDVGRASVYQSRGRRRDEERRQVYSGSCPELWPTGNFEEKRNNRKVT